ncbi:MAG: AAA family ATPase [Actinobacteria bacterium]|nr:AAA family ATPase [Actinomycetota bacterium]
MPACSRCGQDNPEIARFCLACGAALAESGRMGEERRVVSVIFVDLVGFTADSERLDPEDVRALLNPYYERVRFEIERRGGSVEKFVGDAVMGVFGAPISHGDDPERAVRAALAVREWAEEQDGLDVRVGVNTGEAIVTLDARPSLGEAMVAGDVVNTAARLQSAAPIGSVIVGEETHSSTRTVIDYRPAPPVVAKGKSLPVRAWLAVGALADAGERPLTRAPMVGRTRELEVLSGIWDRASAERRPHLVTVFGPAGIGKSRLAVEFAQLVASRGGRVIRGRSTPYGASSPYSAFAQHVKQVAGVFDSDQLADAHVKLRRAVENLVAPEEAEEHAANLAMLIGLDGGRNVSDRETLFFSARVLVEALAAREPILLLFEDIHWADGSLLDLLETLATRTREAPLLLLALARPELLSDRPGWGGGLPAYTALPLDRLSEECARELAERLLAQADEQRPRAVAVAETAEGNPLFIEELAATLVERGGAASAELPTSIRAIVAARLDALPPPERALLLDASVVGRVFWRGALARIASRDDLSACLGSLEARDFVRREAVSRIQGDQQYAFKHGLIRDVAYQTLPRAARRERHAIVAGFLEETTGEVGQSHEALAHHRREAGDHDRAVHHFIAAGDQAGRGWAKERAVSLYRQALELVPEDDDRRRDISRRLAVALQALFHLPDAQRLRQVDRPTPAPGSAESHPG